MGQGGYAGRVLRVDLTTRKVVKEPLDMDMARRFIGGPGANYRLLPDALRPGTDPP